MQSGLVNPSLWVACDASITQMKPSCDAESSALLPSRMRYYAADTVIDARVVHSNGDTVQKKVDAAPVSPDRLWQTLTMVRF